MIPKKIHYCWFGGKPLPEDYKRYIETWRQYMPDYELCRWDENNYDVRCVPFSAEAYEAGKFAFVSDYARLKILYEQGGLYLDTDVEVLRPLDDIMSRGDWMAVERHSDDTDHVNVGLGFAVAPGSPIVREALDFYEQQHYRLPDGQCASFIIVTVLTNILRAHGLPEQINEPTTIAGLTIYPHDYFSPKRDDIITLTPNTHTIHHYAASWRSPLYNFLRMLMTTLLSKRAQHFVSDTLRRLGKKY